MAAATREKDIPGIVDALIKSYDEAVGALRHALACYLTSGERPSAAAAPRGCSPIPSSGSNTASGGRRPRPAGPSAA